MELKFRMPIFNFGKFVEWHHWGFLTDETGYNFVSPHSDYRNCPSTQFTGLKDKNGVDIYEGDIVAGEFGNHMLGTKSRNVKIINCIVTRNGRIEPLCRYGDYRFFPHISKTEVIGNIYETPELYN